MSEQETLRSRLYTPKETSRKGKYLRPKNPGQIPPSLIRQKQNISDTQQDILISKDSDNSRPHTSFSNSRGQGNAPLPNSNMSKAHTDTKLSRLVIPEDQHNLTSRPQTALKSPISPVPFIAVPRAKPPTLVPMKKQTILDERATVRPSTAIAIEKRASSPIGQRTTSTKKEIDESQNPIFRLRRSNIQSQQPEDFQLFKLDPLYSSDIPDELWNDKQYIFYYIRLIHQKNFTEEFLYFDSEPANEKEPENVYLLHVILPSEVNKEKYWTLSSDGVTCYTQMKGEFSSLQQWLRECVIYIKIKGISFFARYDKWRSFSLLRSITQKQQANHSKQGLNQALYHADPLLFSAILDLQQVCNEISSLLLIDVKSSQTLSLNQFIVRQEEHCEEVQEQIRQLRKRARISLMHACDLTYENTGSQHEKKDHKDADRENEQISNENIEKVDDSRSMKKKETAIRLGIIEPKKSKKSSKLKGKGSQSKKKVLMNTDMMVYTQLAAQRFCYRRLARFLKLCDTILVHTYHKFIMNSLKALIDFLEPRGNTSGGDITRLSTELIIDQQTQQLAFSPSENETRDSIHAVWERLLAKAYTFKTFSKYKSLSQYTQIHKPDEGQEKIKEAQNDKHGKDEMTLESIIREDTTYQNMIGEIRKRIATAYCAANAHIENYQQFLVAYLQNSLFDIEKIKENDPPASFYSDSIMKYKTEIKEMNALGRTAQVHMLLIILTQFCNLISPSPRHCLEQLNILIPITVQQKVDKMANFVTDALSIFHDEPSDIHVFVAQLEYRKKLTTEMDQLHSQYQEITNFYQLIQANNITTNDDALGQYKGLGTLITQLESLLLSMNEEEEAKIKKWVPSLSQLLQKLRQELLDFQVATGNDKVMSAQSNTKEVISYLKDKQNDLQNIKERTETVQHYQRVLQVKVSAVDELTIVTQDLNLKLLLWETYKEWQEKVAVWNPTPFKNIKVEEFSNDLQNFTRIAMQVNSGLPDHPLTSLFKSAVGNYNEILPVIVALANPDLNSTHWAKIEHVCNLNKIEESNFPLIYLMDRQIGQFVEKIESISNDASNEASLLKMLHEIEITWEHIEFTLVPHKDIKDFYLVGDLDDVIAQLEESQVQLSTIRSSRYVGAIKSQVDELSKSMNTLAKVLDLITQFQIAFNSLTKVFSSHDIQSEKPTESKDLNTVERQFKAWGHKARDSPRVFKICANQKAQTQFEQWISVTDHIQKELENFLQEKRTAFPRFYFLSNENLLKIFAEARNPKAVQPFLPKLFDGIHTLVFSPTGQDILSMKSVEGEVIDLVKCQTIGAIEAWMSAVEKSMMASLRRVLKSGRASYEQMDRIEWIVKQPAQVVSVISQIYFTLFVEEALSSNEPNQGLQDLKEKIDFNLSALADLVRQPLDKAKRSGVVALITLDVHSRDIVSELISAQVENAFDFEWAKRLRYYWDEEMNCVKICQANASIKYGYEYLGATSRLVVTPLTERCYLTLTSALQNYLGGSPAGPAGTGKTETVKDLAKAVGNFCVVFNCSDAVTVIQMESFFSGLAQAGAWACFDEFNRINSEVLSVIAEQVYTVQQAVASNVKDFVFCGHNIPLNPSVGTFITMNPGYAGRTELPDNLKALFRPISMMVPDYAMIAEVVLYSEGFRNAKPLAQKVTQLYQLSSQMLSSQSHYDFGMRALKSVLVMAGVSKRRTPDLNEDIILIRSMRDSNISKLLIDDTALFDAIISDLFPGVQFENENFTEITSAINQCIVKQGLSDSEYMITKTIQLYQTIFIRHGVMLVGPTGGGKTTSRNILAEALGILGTPVFPKEINPKAVTLTDLYGAYNLVTGDWKNGLVGKMFSEMAEADLKTQQWIIFDGPVDALWIENMNTVLDDNKLLSLANSDRIKMTDAMHLLFEVGDLAQASPATVSRCGMVYYQPQDLGWRPFIKRWIKKQPECSHELYDHLFEQTFDPAFSLIQESCKSVIPINILNAAESVCFLIEALFSSQSFKLSELKSDVLEKYISSVFAFALAWGFGGILTEETRTDFDTFMREIFERKITYPSRKTLFDYYLRISDLSFTPWSDFVSDSQPECLKDISYNPTSSTSVIQTTDTIRFSYLLNILIKQKRPVLFLGESGCGKTSIIQSTINQSTIFPILFTLSARTSAAQIQALLETKLLSKRKTLYGPPEGKSAVFVVDDFNLPRPDEYMSQPPIEILRQTINCKGLYNVDELFWFDLEDVTIVAAGQNVGQVTPRFTSKFSIFELPAPSDSVLTRIFESILKNSISSENGFSDNVVGMVDAIVKTSVAFYRKIKVELLPTPSRSHYTFNLRDLSRVIKGILLSNKNSLSDPNTFIKLWFHENLRVFGDRLVDEKDREQMLNTLFEIAKNSLKLKEDQSFFFGEEPLIWTDILNGYGDPERSYQEATSLTQAKAALQTFNSMYKTNVVLFKEAIEHIIRVVRIMRQPSGHCLLVGMGGTGKRTIAKFAGFVADVEIFQPQPTREYRITDFRNDLKGIFKMAGVQNKSILFLMTDEQIVDESFLEDINNILNTGEVPGLFDSEEYDQMVNELVPMMKKSGESLAYDSLCNRFTSNIKNNLHIVLALSPVGGRFRDRCRIFPSLVSCCTIDWFEPWPRAALKAVANEFVSKIDLMPFISETIEPKSQQTDNNQISAKERHVEMETLNQAKQETLIKLKELQEGLAEIATFAHALVASEAIRFQNELNKVYYVTPAVYIEFFSLFQTMLTKKVADVSQQKGQLEKGVEKLTETNSKVQEMEAELQELNPQLQKKAVETDALLKRLQVDREKVNEAHRQISAEEEVVAKVREEALSLAKEAQADLDKALPLLNAALAAVEELKAHKSDLAVVKTFIKPPQLVVDVMEAVCLLCGKNPDWSSAKQLLAQTDFVNRLLEVHQNPVAESVLVKIRQMAADPKFEYKKVKGVSESAACLFTWVTAIEKFVTEKQKIAPKEKRRNEAKIQLEEAERKLKIKQDELQVISTQLASLQLQYDDSKNQQKELSQKIKQCEYRLKNASQLTTALDSERVRWTDNLRELSIQEKCILGDTVLNALHVAYIGPFSYPYRQKIIEELIAKCLEVGIQITPNFQLEKVATTPIVLREWQATGLPQDALSRQNGVLVTASKRWPLLIDPQGQGRKWLLEYTQAKIVRCDEDNYPRIIENAIRLGNTILVEDVGETLDTGLQFILAPKMRKQGGHLSIQVGDKWVDYDPQFKLYLTTKLSNPQYLPDVFIQLSVINFSVTLEGLEDQLLSEVVLHEMPQLETQRSELIVAISKDQKQLESLMAQILNMLFTSKGNILDNEKLIKTLNEAKSTSTKVSKRLIESEKTEKKISEQREVYRGVAHRGSLLYFVVLELPGIDSMYQYSLEFFKKIFNGVLDAVSGKRAPLNIPIIKIGNQKKVEESLGSSRPTHEEIPSSVKTHRTTFAKSSEVFNFKPIQNSTQSEISDAISIESSHLLLDKSSKQSCESLNVETEEQINEKCTKFIEKLTSAVFSNVSRGLFADHRQVFSFLIATGLMRNNNTISDDEWKLFLRDPPEVDMEKKPEPDSRIEPRLYAKACALAESLPQFKGIDSSFNEDYDKWEPFILEEDLSPPSPYSKLPLFQQIIIAHNLVPRKIIPLVRELVKEQLGEEFIKPTDISLEAPFADTSSDTPLLFVLSQGADPRESLEKLAEKKGILNKLKILSLGQGRAPTARNLIESARNEGNWVFLQNCHLCPSFLPELEQIIQRMSREVNKLHINFRLFLSSMPAESFPISILRNSVKVTSEPPTGIQPNVNLLLNTLDSNTWENSAKPRPWKKLLFSTALFHATIQERKRFGAIGFNKIYEWNSSDYEISIKMLYSFISSSNQVPWEAIKQMIGDVAYGGRVTDDWDRRCMNAILDRFLNQRILSDNVFYDSEKQYMTPPLSNFNAALEHVKTFPLEDRPSLFGFHPSALNTLQLRQSSNLVSWVIGVQPKDSGGAASTQDDEIVYQMCESFETTLPQIINVKNASPTLFEESYGGRQSSLTVFLLQEVERYNKLLSEVSATLIAVEKAIKGEVVMSIDIAEIYRSLLNRQVPEAWKKKSYPSQKPLMSWFKDLIERVNFISTWLKKGEPNVFWFPGFYFPQSFLTAVLQNFSRKHQVPIDKLSFEATIIKEDTSSITHAAPDGAYISGMFFDGAAFDINQMKLIDADANNNYSECPIVHILPKTDFVHPQEDYKCPVYRTPERAGVLSTTGHSTNFVVALNIPTSDEPDKWTLRGTALLLSTPY